MSETMPSRAQVRRIVREYGNPPSALRRAIVMMRRRGIGWKRAREAVYTVNAAHAGQNLDTECLLATLDNVLLVEEDETGE